MTNQSVANNKLFWVCTTIRFALALSLLESLGVGPAAAQIRNTVVGTAGSAAPAGGTYQSFSSLSMNDNSQVAFSAVLTGASNAAIFVADHSGTSAVALAGNADPAAHNFLSVNLPIITANGNVIFNADTGLFQSKGKKLFPLVPNGEVLPGVGTLTPELFVANCNNKVAFSADVINSVSTLGIFRANGGKAETVVRDNTSTPTGGSFVGFNGFAINENGQVAFEAIMNGGSADFGVFRKDGAETKVIFATNQSAPGGGLFGDFSDPVINARGEVAAVSAPLQNSTSSFGVFLGDGSKATAVALEGHAAPTGGNYHLSVFAPLVLNDQGELLFNIGLTGGIARSGIFRAKRDHTETIALEGGSAPGTTGTFAAFQNMRMLNNGRFAFAAQLTLGVGNVGVSNNMGIWVGTSSKDLQLLARTGDTIGGNSVCVPTGLDQFDLNERSVAWISRCPHRMGTVIILSAFDSREGGRY